MKEEYKMLLTPKYDDKDNLYWTCSFPELEGCIGGGGTPEEAVTEAKINLKVYLQYLEETKTKIMNGLDEIQKGLTELEKYRQIKSIIENSSQTKCTLPNGKTFTCDMGYVGDFWREIEEWINN